VLETDASGPDRDNLGASPQLEVILPSQVDADSSQRGEFALSALERVATLKSAAQSAVTKGECDGLDSPYRLRNLDRNGSDLLRFRHDLTNTRPGPIQDQDLAAVAYR
jgi:hypothetical protein